MVELELLAMQLRTPVATTTVQKRLTRSENMRLVNLARGARKDEKFLRANADLLAAKAEMDDLVADNEKKDAEMQVLKQSVDSLVIKNRNRRRDQLKRAQAKFRQKERAIAKSAEAELNLCGKFLRLSSYRDQSMARRVLARSKGKKRLRKQSGLSTEKNVKAALNVVKEEVMRRGFELAAAVSNVKAGEGMVRDPETVLIELLDLHVNALKGKCVDDTKVTETEVRMNHRFGTDGFPVVSTEKAHTQSCGHFDFFKPELSTLVFMRLMMHVAHDEDHPVTRACLLWLHERTSNLLQKSAAGELHWHGRRVVILAAVPTVDWAMSAKLNNCHTASSMFVGYMLRLTRDQWPTLLGIGEEELEALLITPDVRRELGKWTSCHIQAVEKKWKQRNATFIANNPDVWRKKWEVEKKSELKAYSYNTKNPQKGEPMSMMELAMHCVLHGKLRVAPRQAKCLIHIDQAFIVHLSNNSMLNTISRDVTRQLKTKMSQSMNVNGRQASEFFRACPTIASKVLTEDANVKNFLILVHVITCVLVRDVIGNVMSTKNWSDNAVKELGRTGRQCFNLNLAVFGHKRLQPHLFALCMELPLQVKLHFKFCKANNVTCDTTPLNAQDSEHINKTMKEMERLISAHVHVTGEDSMETRDHLKSRCALSFIHECVTKELALVHDLLSPGEVRQPKKKRKENCVLPEEGKCEMCGCCDESDTHRLVCEHEWMESLKVMLETGKTPERVSNMLKSAEAQSMLLAGARVQAETKATHQGKAVSVSTEKKVMTRARKSLKKSRAAPRRRRMRS